MIPAHPFRAEVIIIGKLWAIPPAESSSPIILANPIFVSVCIRNSCINCGSPPVKTYLVKYLLPKVSGCLLVISAEPSPLFNSWWERTTSRQGASAPLSHFTQGFTLNTAYAPLLSVLPDTAYGFKITHLLPKCFFSAGFCSSLCLCSRNPFLRLYTYPCAYY